MPNQPATPEQAPKSDDAVHETTVTQELAISTAEGVPEEQPSQFVRLGRIGAFGPSLDGDFYA